MTPAIQRAAKLARGYLPRHGAAGAETERRGLTTLLFVAVFITQAPLFAAFYWLVGVPFASLVVGLAGPLAVACVPLFTRSSVRLGSNALLLILWSAFVAVAFVTDGHRSGALFWLAALPVVATLTTTGRDPVAWLVASALAPLALWGYELNGGAFEVVRSGLRRDTFFVLCISMLACVLYGLAYAYESARRAQIRTVEVMNHDMRLVLDNVEQGFLIVRPDGRMQGGHSAITERWLGAPDADALFSDWVGRSDPRAGDALVPGLEQLFDNFLPVSVSIDQLPRHCRAGGTTLDLCYRPIMRDGTPSALVVIVSDAAERLQAEHAEAAQRELSTFAGHWARDRQGALHFLAEAEQIVEELAAGTPSALRLVHTLKGNAGLFGLRGVASTCHDVESEAKEAQRPPSPDELARIRQAWAEASARIAPLFAHEAGDELSISRSELTDILDALDADTPRESVRRMVVELHHEPAERVFKRFGEQAAALARRLGKGEIAPVYEPNGLRFDAERWGPVWSAMVHAVRNAVDHGGEPEEERVARGKPRELTLRFRCGEDSSGLRVEMSDDGAGVDWERVREKARSRELPHETPADLEAALFSDGLSTRDEASEVSGRGVGLGALREACRALGGDVRIHSSRGQGTTLTLHVPRGANSAQRAA